MQLTNCFLASQENGLKFQADGDRLTPVPCVIYRLSRLQKLTSTNGTVKIRPAPLPSPAEVPEHSVSLTELQLIGFRITTANLRFIAKSLTGLTLLELSNCVRANPASKLPPLEPATTLTTVRQGSHTSACQCSAADLLDNLD